MPTAVIPTAFPKDETERKRRRQDVRERIAEIEILRMQIADVDREIAALDQRLDAAVEKHQSETTPAQSALAELVATIKEKLALREKLPAEIEKRRRTRLAEVAEANERLTEEKAAIERLRSPLVQERQRLQLQCGELDVLRNALGGQALADPGLFAKRFAGEQSETWASRRHKHAANEADTWRHRERAALERRESENAEIYRRRADRWAVERDAAAEALAAAKREAEKFRQQVVDE